MPSKRENRDWGYPNCLRMALIWAGVLYPPLHQTVVPHAVIMTLGGFLVAGAHLANMRLMREHVAGEACDATCVR